MSQLDLSFLKGTVIEVVDLETTTNIVSKAFVREFGIAEYVDGVYTRGNGGLFSGGESAPGALAVHGITDESVVGKPTFASRAAKVGEILNGKILMGHNMEKFDLPIIQRVLLSQGVKIVGAGPSNRIQVIDTLLAARRYLRVPSNRLADLCAMFGIEHGNHRAHGDALSCWSLFLKIVETTGRKELDQYISLV